MQTPGFLAARDDPAMPDEQYPRDPPRVVAAAYLLAAVCVVVPFAVIGALFAGIVLVRRNRSGAGAGVIALSLACTAAGVALLR